MSKRVALIVLDSVGAGYAPDAEKFGDVGANTLMNIKKVYPQLELPNMVQMGLSHIEGLAGLGTAPENFTGSVGRLQEVSMGKDTTTGHWEISGILVDPPFPTFPNGFPQDLIEEFERAVGRKVVGNCVASGTEILDQLGEHHVKTGDLIVYTSADSVFQIAAHEEVVPIDELYRICEIARDLLVGDLRVSRVIARPFIGTPGNWQRTSNRHDYAVAPFHKTMLDYISNAGQHVHAIGKISDIFLGNGVTTSVHTKNNGDGIDATLNALNSNQQDGLIFTNLVDFDSVYGHRRNPEGYGDALMEFDRRLPEIIASLKDEDMLMITADHGCDPTYKGTDHTREYIPLLVYGKNIESGVNLGTRPTFSDIAKTITDYLNVTEDLRGTSFLSTVVKK